MVAMSSGQLLIISVAVVFGLWVEAQPDPNICVPGPGDNKNHTLPTIPEQFKLTVYAYFQGKNYSLTNTEYYDFPNNQESIWSKPHGDSYMGEHRTYMDYNDTQYYIVTPNETAFGSYICETKPITNNSFGGMGNGHIRKAKDIFRFGEMYNETYMGTVDVNHRQADWWSSCVYEDFGNFSYNYKVDFYFEAGADQAAIPMRVVINGTGSYPSRPSHTFYHVYSFHDVVIGPQPQEEFLPPVGVMCPGRVPGKTIPEPPDYFSLSWEIVTKSQKRISYGKEYYRYSDKMVAIEFVEPIGTKYEYHIPTRVVNDYNTGVSYIIHYNGCNVTSISIYSFDAATKDNQHVSLKSPSDFFALHSSDVHWIYEGRSTMRDVVLDVWQSYRTNWKPIEYMFRKDVYVNSTWLYSFLVDGWKVDGGIPHWHSGMLPFRLDIEYAVYSTKTGKQIDADSLIYNFYQATDMMFEDALFDVSMCYNHFNESLHLAFTLEGKDTYNKYIANNTWHFKNGAIQSISDAIDVSPTRIANFEVLNGFKDLSTIFFTLLDRPKVEGDAVNATDPGPILGTAHKLLDLLVNSKDGSKLTIEFIKNEKIMKVNAITGSLREETQPWMKDKPIGVSAGTVVGIAICTFVVGIIIALLCAFVVFKAKTREIPYGVQD